MRSPGSKSFFIGCTDLSYLRKMNFAIVVYDAICHGCNFPFFKSKIAQFQLITFSCWLNLALLCSYIKLLIDIFKVEYICVLWMDVHLGQLGVDDYICAK